MYIDIFQILISGGVKHRDLAEIAESFRGGLTGRDAVGIEELAEFLRGGLTGRDTVGKRASVVIW